MQRTKGRGGGEKEFVETLSGTCGSKYVVGRTIGKEGQEGHKQGDKSEATRHKYHDNDRKWQEIGSKCKLVCNSQVTTELFNGALANIDSDIKPCIDKVHNSMYKSLSSRRKPYGDSQHCIEWGVGVLISKLITLLI